MDPSGKLIYTRNHDVLSGNLQTISDPSSSPSTSFADGSRLPLSTKEIGSTEIFATSLLHSPNGRFVTVVGDGEYIIYTSLAWRNKSFGNGISFAWAPDSNTYAVLESKVKLKIFKNFRERPGTGMKGSGSWSMESLHGGTLLGARGNGFVMFWDWESGEIVRRIDVEAKNVGFHQSLSFCTIRFYPFFCLGFLVRYRFFSCHYSWRLFLHPSIRSRCLQRESRRRRGNYWWRCRGGIRSCYRSIRGVCLKSFLSPKFSELISNPASRRPNGLVTASSTLHLTGYATLLVLNPTPSVPSTRKPSLFSKTIF